jgi:ADP-heptose:LPS heptosyltransferase
MLSLINEHNKTIDCRNAKTVLFLYDEIKIFMGDTYVMINKLSCCQAYFTQAQVDINCRNKNHTALYTSMLKNNPYIRQVTNEPWETLDLAAYDLILCINRDEAWLLELLGSRYAGRISSRKWATAVYSLSAQMLNVLQGPIETVFQPFDEIIEHTAQYAQRKPSELYISQEEKEWANQWLQNKGVQPFEHVYVLVDSASSRDKLLTPETSYALLQYLLNKEAVKILLFDPQNIGKETFFSNWLGEQHMSKLIFAKKLGLRNDLCLLSADYVKLILGPCTGIMHCASGIYNYFVRAGMEPAAVPQIITYTGKYDDDPMGANKWWGHSPLVKCLLIRSTVYNQTEVIALSELTPEEKASDANLLKCDAYTPEHIISFIPQHTQAIII